MELKKVNIDRQLVDQRLVAESVAGNRAAYEQLYRKHVDSIYSFFCWSADNELEAEDLTQQVFIAAWEKLHQFKHRSSFRTWLFSIAISIRKTDRRKRLRRESRESNGFDESLYLPPGRPYSAELLMDLERAIRRLPGRAKVVLVLFELQGMKHQEVSAVLGISEGTSKAQLNRAKRLLKKEIEK